MDYWRAIKELYAEKQRLDRVIGVAEAIVNGQRATPPVSPGRRRQAKGALAAKRPPQTRDPGDPVNTGPEQPKA